MSNNASGDLDQNQEPDNPQEMLKSNFYFSGLMAGEMSCSIIKATNRNPSGYYYPIDITITNADLELLHQANRVVMQDRGVITPVKGAYNLSARGKERVRIVLDFLEIYPILVGDHAINRILLMKQTLAYLQDHRTHKFQEEKTMEMEKLRSKLKDIKERGIIDQEFDLLPTDRESLGHFFAGVIDGEGSFGTKSSGRYQQPFFAIAMKDGKIIEALRESVSHGNVRLRKDGVYHLEINHRGILKRICNMFLDEYPLRHERQRRRLQLLQQLLNDHTLRSLNLAFGEYDMV